MKLDEMRRTLKYWNDWATTEDGKQCLSFTALVGREDPALNGELKERVFQAFCAGLNSASEEGTSDE